MMFVSWLAQSLAPASVAVYLASVRSLHLEYGFDDPTVATPRLRRVLKGIRRSSSHVRSHRLPITKVILRSLHAQLSVVPSDVDATMFWAACCLAFFGFLRVSEFATRGPFISSRHLSLADVAVSSGSPPSAIRLRLKFSKTDPFGTGCFVYLGRSGHDICPVSALLHYLSLRGDTAGPLFVWRDGSPLSPAQVNFYLRDLLSRAGITGTYSSHSFRIGAATAAAAAGVPEHLIQTMGRWSSMAYLAYVRTSPEHIASIAPIL